MVVKRIEKVGPEWPGSQPSKRRANAYMCRVRLDVRRHDNKRYVADYDFHCFEVDMLKISNYLQLDTNKFLEMKSYKLALAGEADIKKMSLRAVAKQSPSFKAFEIAALSSDARNDTFENNDPRSF